METSEGRLKACSQCTPPTQGLTSHNRGSGALGWNPCLPVLPQRSSIKTCDSSLARPSLNSNPASGIGPLAPGVKVQVAA